MQRRRLIAALSSAALAAGLLAGGATPASAADIGTIIVTYQGGTTLNVDQLVGSVGDTFVVDNDFTSTDLEIVSGSAAISEDGTDCTGGRTCPVDAGEQGTFTIDALGTFQVVPASGLSTRTVSIVGSSQVTQTPPVTMTFDGNGGNCSSNPIEISGRGGATYNLPTEGSGSGQCQRDNYSLLGWSHDQDATSVDPNLTPGATVAFANAGGSMYAVWVPTGVEVTYDANVGTGDECRASGASTGTRTSTSVVEAGSATDTSAPCTPPGMEFEGWALTGDGDVVTQPGGALPDLGTSGSSLQIYAKWQVTYGISITPAVQVVEPDQSATITISATKNGIPAAGVDVEYEWTGMDEFGRFDSGSSIATTSADGTVTVSTPWTFTPTVFATFGAAYGDQAATATADGRKTVTITGERTPVGGRPGIRIEGTAAGFPEGTELITWYKFPGWARYSRDRDRPAIDADGDFVWESRTDDRKQYVYVSNEDGSVRSNRVVIPAR